MNKTIIGLCTAVFLVGTGWVGHSSAEETTTAQTAGALDNKTFVGEMGDQGKEKGDPDNFVFKGGQFESTACVAYGFGTAPYMTTAQEGNLSFSATTTSDKMGKMNWVGTIKGDMIEGTATLMSEGKEPAVKWFKGKIMAAEKMEEKK